MITVGHFACKREYTVLKALYSLLNWCRRAHLVSWSFSKFLFKILVLSVLLYGIQVWGSGCNKTGWDCVKRVQKIFLQEELNVRSQTPYAIILLKTDCLSLEAEDLYLTITYIRSVRSIDASRLLLQALSATRGWLADVITWSLRCNVAQRNWDVEPVALRERLKEKFQNNIWSKRSIKMQFINFM